ncbi:hypothetical protein [Frigoribacterium salinisoli]
MERTGQAEGTPAGGPGPARTPAAGPTTAGAHARVPGPAGTTAWAEATAATRRLVAEGEEVRFSTQLAMLLIAAFFTLLAVLITSGGSVRPEEIAQVALTGAATVLGLIHWLASRRTGVLVPFLGVLSQAHLAPLDAEQRRSFARAVRGREADPGPAAPLVLAQLDLAARRDRSTVRSLLVAGLAVLGAAIGSSPWLVALVVACAAFMVVMVSVERRWHRRARVRSEAALARAS